MDFAVVVLCVHDDDEVSGDVDAPAERTRGHHHLNSTCQRRTNKAYSGFRHILLGQMRLSVLHCEA